MADPDWEDPLDAVPALSEGGRWSAPDSFPVVYLNGTVALARRFVAYRLRGQPYGPEDLDPDRGPLLVMAEVPTDEYVDIVTDPGCTKAGLPATYPFMSTGEVVPHEDCWPIGQQAWDIGEPGIACRSAMAGASLSDEELAWFQHDQGLNPVDVKTFSAWFFGVSS